MFHAFPTKKQPSPRPIFTSIVFSPDQDHRHHCWFPSSIPLPILLPFRWVVPLLLVLKLLMTSCLRLFVITVLTSKMARLPSVRSLLSLCDSKESHHCTGHLTKKAYKSSGPEITPEIEPSRSRSSEDQKATQFPTTLYIPVLRSETQLGHLGRKPEPQDQYLKDNMENPLNETFAECRRATVTGRKLSYRLQVLQQPERARACGAGRKCEFEI